MLSQDQLKAVDLAKQRSDGKVCLYGPDKVACAMVAARHKGQHYPVLDIEETPLPDDWSDMISLMNDAVIIAPDRDRRYGWRDILPDRAITALTAYARIYVPGFTISQYADAMTASGVPPAIARRAAAKVRDMQECIDYIGAWGKCVTIFGAAPEPANLGDPLLEVARLEEPWDHARFIDAWHRIGQIRLSVLRDSKYGPHTQRATRCVFIALMLAYTDALTTDLAELLKRDPSTISHAASRGRKLLELPEYRRLIPLLNEAISGE